MYFLDRVSIKKEARAFIAQNRRWLDMFFALLPLIIATNIFNVIYSVKVSVDVANEEFYRNTVAGSGWRTIGSIISVIAIPFTIAAAGYFLNHLRGLKPEWKSLYYEGKERYGKYFEVGFITGLIVFLWSLLFIIPGVVKGYAYSQTDYIIHDNPNLSSEDARRISDIMTKGYKGELFVKDLSFILWVLFSIVTLGIASIYLTVYKRTVDAMYYEKLKMHAVETGLIAPESFGLVPVFDQQETYTPDSRPIVLNGEEYNPEDGNSADE